MFDLSDYRTLGVLALWFVLLFATAKGVLRSYRSRKALKALKGKRKGEGASGHYATTVDGAGAGAGYESLAGRSEFGTGSGGGSDFGGFGGGGN